MSHEIIVDSPGVWESDLRLLQAGNFMRDLVQIVVPGLDQEGARSYEDCEAGLLAIRLRDNGVLSDSEYWLAQSLISAMNDLLGEGGRGDCGIGERYTNQLLEIREDLGNLEPLLRKGLNPDHAEFGLALFSAANEYLDWAMQDSRLPPIELNITPGESLENNLLDETRAQIEKDDAA